MDFREAIRPGVWMSRGNSTSLMTHWLSLTHPFIHGHVERAGGAASIDSSISPLHCAIGARIDFFLAIFDAATQTVQVALAD